MSWQHFLFIGLGGFLGSVSRYLCTVYISRWLPSQYPWGTFAVNMAGCFILGVLLGLFEQQTPGERWRLFLAVGFCGSFTTFSTFSAEGFLLFQKDLPFLSLLYLAGSLSMGIFLAGGGIWVGKQINF